MDMVANLLETTFLRGLHQVLGTSPGLVALHEPELTGSEGKFLRAYLDSTFVSSVGGYVDEFERMLASYCGVKHAVAVVNGTAALEIALRLSGVQRDDEVLVPALSFVATANAVVHAGGVPHFVDSALDTLGLDSGALAAHLDLIADRTARGVFNRTTGRRIAAVVPMHAYGHPVDLGGLMEVADRYGIPVVEDAAESLGSTYRGQHAGTFGLLATLSFNGNKIITTGGGGAILTNDSQLAGRAKHLTTTAKRPHRWEFVHDEVAWNFRLPNLNAALGCAQMERLVEFVALKRVLAGRYSTAFAAAYGFQFVSEPAHARSNYWLSTIRLNAPDMATRDGLLAAANDAGYQCRPAWTLLHRLPMFEGSPRAPLPVAERLESSLINLPSSPKLALVMS